MLKSQHCPIRPAWHSLISVTAPSRHTFRSSNSDCLIKQSKSSIAIIHDIICKHNVVKHSLEGHRKKRFNVSKTKSQMKKMLPLIPVYQKHAISSQSVSQPASVCTAAARHDLNPYLLLLPVKLPVILNVFFFNHKYSNF